jgi:hypothetical protein
VSLWLRPKIQALLRPRLIRQDRSTVGFKHRLHKLNIVISAGLADPNLKGQLTDSGSSPLSGSPADFGKLIVEETEKWGQDNQGGKHQAGGARGSILLNPSVVQLLGGRPGE